jgi:hypothetical protein
MLRRLGYRRVLPIANLLLYLTLVGYGDWTLLQNVALSRDVAATQSSEDTSWDPVYIDRPMPLAHVLASSISYPAVLFAIPFGLLEKGWRGDLIVDAVAAIYLIPLWYTVGRWIDRRTIEDVKSRKVLAFFRWTILVLACLTGLGMTGVYVIALKRYPEAWPDIILSLPIFFWPAFLAYVALWELRAAKKRPVAVEAV